MEAIVRVLAAAGIGGHVPALSAVLIDCVQGGASVSFMDPLSEARAGCILAWRGRARRGRWDRAAGR